MVQSRSWWQVSVMVVCSSLNVGCGEPEHPPVVSQRSAPSPGDGGANGSTIPANGGNEASGGDASGGDGSGPGPAPILGGTTFTFDPSQVYFFGSLTPGTTGSDVYAHWSNPKRYAAGFDDDTNAGKLWGQKLLYTKVFEGALREYVVDEVGTVPEADFEYPPDPTLNDPLVDTPPCSVEQGGLWDFLTSPTGRLIYQCDDGIWYEDGEVVFAGEDQLVALGYDNLAAFDGIDFGVIDLVTQERHPTNIHDTVWTIRAHENGFLFVTSGLDDPYGALSLLLPDGSIEKQGQFPPLPAEPEGLQGGFGHTLTPSGELFQPGHFESPTLTDVVVRRTIEGTSEVIYNEADDPYVYFAVPYLVTGP
ncbi:MAG TPA: hypothetical protein VM686_19970 [Polyangiaceae bacterium]|nr:hypothetical protein [Polyangiaceae bacterium]